MTAGRESRTAANLKSTKNVLLQFLHAASTKLESDHAPRFEILVHAVVTPLRGHWFL
jgi:hypothetical protein